MNKYLENFTTEEYLEGQCSSLDILRKEMVCNNYVFASTELANLRITKKITKGQYDRAAKVIFPFVQEMGDFFEKDDVVFEFGEFMQSCTVVMI